MDTPPSFDFGYFINFLNKNNVIAIAIASVLSENIRDISGTFIESIIMPIIDRDSDGDGKRDIHRLADKTVTISGVTLKLGVVLVAIIRFILITIVLYGFSHLVQNGFNSNNTSNSKNTSK